jgi:hypothetical protein
MPLLHNLANKLADKYAPSVDAWARDIVNAIPRTGAEGEMRRLHDEWLRGAQLNRPYWTEDSEYFWMAENHGGGDLRLACTEQFTFVRRDRLGLYTARGTYSWPLFLAAGPKGLITTEPPRPGRPEGFFIEADLADAAHPERWTFVDA